MDTLQGDVEATSQTPPGAAGPLLPWLGEFTVALVKRLLLMGVCTAYSIYLIGNKADFFLKKRRSKEPTYGKEKV